MPGLTRAGPVRRGFGSKIFGIASLVVSMLVPGMPPRAGEASDRVARALSGAGAPTMAFPGLSPQRSARQRAGWDADRAEAFYRQTVEEKLTAKAAELDRARYSGKVAVCFHIGADGRVSSRDLCVKSGDPNGDRFALGIVEAVDPLPPPPPTMTNGGVVWVYTFEKKPRPKRR